LWPIGRYRSRIYLEGLRKTEFFSQDSVPLGQELNPIPLEYEAQTLEKITERLLDDSGTNTVLTEVTAFESE
jgi:hypothetical protein